MGGPIALLFISVLSTGTFRRYPAETLVFNFTTLSHDIFQFSSSVSFLFYVIKISEGQFIWVGGGIKRIRIRGGVMNCEVDRVSHNILCVVFDKPGWHFESEPPDEYIWYMRC